MIAFFEAMKGALVIVAGFGLLQLIHRNAQEVAEEIVRHLHLNPASHIPRIFLHVAESATDGRILLLALAALFYAGVRFAEAWGLWHDRTWAEWLGIVTGGMYLPVELFEVFRSITAVRMGVFVVNLVIVVWLSRVRWLKHRPANGYGDSGS